MSGAEWIALIGGLAIGFCIVYIVLGTTVKPRLQAHESRRFEQQESNYKEQRHGAQDSIGERWFLILEVPQSASRADIELAYKRKISQYHPDKVAQMGVEIRELAEAKSKEINAAYDHAVARF